jgi:hypothetical protein
MKQSELKQLIKEAISDMAGNDSSMNMGQENVIKYYVSKLRKFEQDNTADMADLKNLKTAMDMYYKELINKIR